MSHRFHTSGRGRAWAWVVIAIFAIALAERVALDLDRGSLGSVPIYAICLAGIAIMAWQLRNYRRPVLEISDRRSSTARSWRCGARRSRWPTWLGWTGATTGASS